MRISALVIAGAASFFAFFLGLMELAWSGFGRGKDSVSIFFFLLPFLFAFPLFLFSLGGTRFAPLGLWILVPYHWLSLIHLASQDPSGSIIAFLKLLVLITIQRQMLLLLLLASLVQFGIQVVPTFRIDEYFYERLRRNDDSRG